MCAAALLAAVLAGRSPAAGAVNAPRADGAAITPAVAQAIFDRIAPLQEADGCRLARLDTSRFYVTVTLTTAAGTAHTLDLAARPARAGSEQQAGGWAITADADTTRECARTLAAMTRELGAVAAPAAAMQGAVGWFLAALQIRDATRVNWALLSLSFVLLIAGTLWVLVREARAGHPPRAAVVTLVVLWLAALLLRLLLSPHTFLHEYYHIADTLDAYLVSDRGSLYGNTGPALFRLVGAVLGRPDDVRMIFLTNAFLSALAIPAAAFTVLALTGAWPAALCAAALVAVFPQHLRFSAAEDLFVEAVTFGLWTVALFALYLRTRRFGDALLGALALGLAMQTRPEMLLFPIALVALVILVAPRSWRVLLTWRSVLALSVVASLLIPRLLALQENRRMSPALTTSVPNFALYWSRLVFLRRSVTPPAYWIVLAIGFLHGMRRKPGFYTWLALVFVGYTLFSLSLFNNDKYNVRSQLLPTTFLVLGGAGAASLWTDLWRGRRGLVAGACALAGFAATVLVGWRGFVTELGDQQLEWAFLERAVPALPPQGTLLSTVESGGHNLDNFPEFLLARAGKAYTLVDVRKAFEGESSWPEPSDGLLYYQGMFCYFAFDDEPSPDPMTPLCRAVHAHYVLEPLVTEDVAARGYSPLRYAGDGDGPFHIGFFRVRSVR